MPQAYRDGVRLFYDDVGAGPAVLLHTGGGGDGRMWREAGYVSALPGYRVLSLDHRGHGRSDKPADRAQHHLSEYVADVIAVLDEAAVDRTVLIGYSFGARVAYAVAANHPDRVTAVVGLGTLHPPDEDPAADAEWAAEVRAQGMRAAMEAIADDEPEPAPSWLIDNLASTDPEMFALLLEGLTTSPTVWDDLPAITAPVLILCGEREGEGAGRLAQAAVGRLRQGRQIVFPGLAHLQLFWRSDLTLAPITTFLRQTAPPS